jgi:DMSO/TMAO reductase YedYZ molybdopterin-dependent catalytic subunit
LDATTRRRFFDWFGAGVAAVLGSSAGCSRPSAQRPRVLPFVGESDRAVGVVMGAGLDGRLAFDLSTLEPETLITPNDSFFIRTREPDALDSRAPWTVSIRGLVKHPKVLALGDLLPLAEPQGTHLLECSGNGSFSHFGLISAASWAGVPIAKVLKHAEPLRGASRVLVSGFDRHSLLSLKSDAGASWVFTREELESSGAFLATGMNGQALARDHGRPIRLVVPGWYGCACIKWVDEIAFVDDDASATGQMREFASRTHQDGVPVLAKDYQPARIDLVAMPVRVEAWRADGQVICRVLGILWGGERTTDALVIRFDRDSEYVPVEHCDHRTNATWTLWSHTWLPRSAGRHAIQLKVADPSIRTRRLDRGYYLRTVDLDGV